MPDGITLVVDATDLEEKIQKLRSNMKPQQFTNAMRGIFNATTGHVRTVLKKDLRIQYRVKAGQVAKTVKQGRITGGGSNVGLVIPVVGPRLGIGSESGFKATGSAAGWETLAGKHYRKNGTPYKKGKAYKVRAQIVTSGVSTMPDSPHGGQKPFRNSLAKKRAPYPHTFYRVSKSRLPIKKMAGIAIPQMPLNRSEADVRRDIHNYLENRIEHRFQALIRNGL